MHLQSSSLIVFSGKKKKKIMNSNQTTRHLVSFKKKIQTAPFCL
jgi:hypothetical protein